MLVRGSLVGILPKRTFVLITTTTTTTLPNVHILGRNLELAFFEEVLQNWCILRFWTTAGVFRVSAADLSHFCNFACSGRCGIWCNSLIASFQTCGRAIYFESLLFRRSCIVPRIAIVQVKSLCHRVSPQCKRFLLVHFGLQFIVGGLPERSFLM